MKKDDIIGSQGSHPSLRAFLDSVYYSIIILLKAGLREIPHPRNRGDRCAIGEELGHRRGTFSDLLPPQRRLVDMGNHDSGRGSFGTVQPVLLRLRLSSWRRNVACRQA